MQNTNSPVATVPGSFTGIYTNRSNNYSLVKRTELEQVNGSTFANALKVVDQQIKNLKSFSTTGKVQNLPNTLPLTALVLGEVGPYGLIFAGPVLKLCQYYKKVSPPPRYF